MFLYLYLLLITNFVCDQIQCRPLNADDDRKTYNFMYIAPGVQRNESIQIDNRLPNNLVVFGDYQYISSPASNVRVKYVADNAGFHPTVHISIHKFYIPALDYAFDTRKGISSAAIASLSGGGLG